MEMRGKNKKKETNEGEVRVKGGKKEQEEKMGQQTEIRGSADRMTRRRGGRAVM